jgi:serine/threonine protein kinase
LPHPMTTDRLMRPARATCGSASCDAAKVEDAAAVFKRVGTPGFIAPELFRNAGVKSVIPRWRQDQSGLTDEGALTVTKIDVFSFGMLISTALTGTNPFRGDTVEATMHNNAELTYYPDIHFGKDQVNIISEALRSLLSALCAPDPRKRLSASEASAHPWLLAASKYEYKVAIRHSCSRTSFQDEQRVSDS